MGASAQKTDGQTPGEGSKIQLVLDEIHTMPFDKPTFAFSQASNVSREHANLSRMLPLTCQRFHER
eukprot:5940593-Amphidinium_carterae.1